jgi:Fe-S-cluster containining protein
MSDIETPESISKGSQLCMSCGLCCQGIMEKAAVLEPNEIELARELNLECFMADDGIYKFHLPCPLVKENICTVYDNSHPRVCSEFQCLLLDQLLSDEISLEASFIIIHKIKKYINLIKEKISFIDKSKSFMDTVQDCWDSQQDLNRELFFDIAACRYLIFRHIMSPSKPYSIDRLFFPQYSFEKCDG